jgi:hypothetical protein
MIRRSFLALPVAVLALLAALPAAGASAQTPDPQGPQLVYQNVHDGDTLQAPAFALQLCFSAPINIKDLDKGGDFGFSVVEPDNIGLGHRDVFQRDGWGISVYPGDPVGETNGQWTFTYKVSTPDAQHETTGTIHYTVDPAGQPVPAETPPACVASGGTATPSPTPDPNAPTPTPTPTIDPNASPGIGGGGYDTATLTVTPSPSASRTPTPIVTRGPGEEGGGGGPDILKWALITVGVTGGLAFLALIGYFIRRAVGFDWHKPGNGGNSGHH